MLNIVLNMFPIPQFHQFHCLNALSLRAVCRYENCALLFAQCVAKSNRACLLAQNIVKVKSGVPIGAEYCQMKLRVPIGGIYCHVESSIPIGAIYWKVVVSLSDVILLKVERKFVSSSVTLSLLVLSFRLYQHFYTFICFIQIVRSYWS